MKQEIIESLKQENKKLMDLYNDIEQQLMRTVFINNMLNDNIMTFETDKDGNIIYSSELFLNLVGYPKEEIYGQNIFSCNFIDSCSLFYLKDILSVNKMWNGDIRYVIKDKEYLWVHCRVFPIINNDHKVDGYKFINTDITDRKKMDSFLGDIFPMDSFKMVL